MRNSLHVFIGTKAQYIKTAPLLRSMQRAGIDYNLIDSGQHAEFAKCLRKELNIKEPDVFLQNNSNIDTVSKAFIWSMRYVKLALSKSSTLRKRIFGGQSGICIIHGDTPSTLVALILAKRADLKIAHIEAGLRSYNLLRPFPEEIIRIFCMKFSDYLFAPSDWAYENLINMKIKGKKLNIKQNTNVEAMYHSMQHSSRIATHEKDYCVMTIHRVETILKKERLRFVVKAAERISNDLTLFFIMHPPTYEKLVEFGLLDRIVRNKNIFTSGLKRHRTFLNLLANANFAITDGGSIQEETYYLGVPCLIMRCETERQEGIGSNAQMCNFSTDILEKFLANYMLLKRKNMIENNQPSSIILNELINELNYNFTNNQ